MKIKIVFTLLVAFISVTAFGQDTTKNSMHTKTMAKKSKQTTVVKATAKKPIYRDTRLGGSSPLYNSYKKNDKGAGSVTTHSKPL